MKLSLKVWSFLPVLAFTSSVLFAGLPAPAASAATVKLPTVSITQPKSHAQTTDEVYTVTGTVTKGSLAVSNVLVSLNSGPYTAATLSNSFWSIPLALNAGTNTIFAYATDVNGDLGRPANVELLYVVKALLTVQIVGEGSLKPNLNGQPLDLGVDYTMAAKGSNGFSFYYWSGGVTMSANPALRFYMSPGLAITANFRDTTPPTLTITEPKAGGKVDSNATVTVTGTAQDNDQVALVEVRNGGSNWVAATGTTAWSATLPVVAGNNTIQAYAVDQAGNVSKTNEVVFMGNPPPTGPWAPSSVVGSLILLTPLTPAPGATHYLSFDTSTFSYGDTNLSASDSGIGNYDYQPDDTNYSVVQIAFTAPPAVNGDTANLDLNFTAYDTGTYTNEATGETGAFSIETAPSLLPAAWSGNSFTVKSFGSSKTSTVSFGKNNAIQVGSKSGTYTVDDVSPIGAFFTADVTSGTETAYFLLTFTSATEGFFDISYFENGLPDGTGTGTFKK